MPELLRRSDRGPKVTFMPRMLGMGGFCHQPTALDRHFMALGDRDACDMDDTMDELVGASCRSCLTACCASRIPLHQLSIPPQRAYAWTGDLKESNNLPHKASVLFLRIQISSTPPCPSSLHALHSFLYSLISLHSLYLLTSEPPFLPPILFPSLRQLLVDLSFNKTPSLLSPRHSSFPLLPSVQRKYPP